MEIIPAIDIREGACARILSDTAPQADIFSDDPLEQAIMLKELGAQRVHVTDLDGAFSGHLCNLRVIQELVECSGLKIELSGGVRSLEHISTLVSLGVDRVVISGSILRDAALTQRAFEKFAGNILPSIEERDGILTLEGFETPISKSVVKLMEELSAMGFTDCIFTDLRRYWTMKGPNLERVRDILHCSGLRVIVAGGISSYESLAMLRDLGAAGVMIGKAIYTGAIDLHQAIAVAQGGPAPSPGA